MGFVFLAGTIAFTVYGQLIIRQQVGQIDEVPSGSALFRFLIEFIFTRPLVLSGFAAAFMASLCWLATLTKFELSFAYPFMALNFVLVVALAFVAFGETINAYKIVGLLIVCGGLVVVAQGN
ncbi:MAG: hypothetical protein WD598_15855 [Acidimicrobiia bacterium]